MTVKTKTHEENGDLGEAIRLANAYAHCFSFIGDKTMPEAQTALFGHLAKVIPQWQPIETASLLDTEGEPKLLSLFCPHSMGGYILTGYFWQGHWTDNLNTGLPCNPTHWMPLPPPPTTTEVSS